MANVARMSALEEALRPPELGSVTRIGGVALLIAGGAAVYRLTGNAPGEIIDAIRAAACGLALVLAGVGVFRRPDHPGPWLLASAVSALTIFGFPAEWDSGPILTRVLMVVTLIAAGMTQMPITLRWYAATGLALLHFGGILTAVTGPPPQPYLSGQAWVTIYRPYLHFMYLNNAYQFYSPEPGPAVQIWALVKYKTDDKDKQFRWLRLPERPEQMYDPLSLSYFRRVALTERLNAPGSPLESVAEQEAVNRRRNLSPIPRHPDQTVQQYLPPSRDGKELIIPSYARHLCHEAQIPGGPEVESVKLYRVIHYIMPARVMAEGKSIYDPSWYMPFYFGEYDPSGKLLDPKDPMLYWLVPILYQPKNDSTGKPRKLLEIRPEDYTDYVEKHAGSPHGGIHK